MTVEFFVPQAVRNEMLRVAMWEFFYGCGDDALPAIARWLRAGAMLEIPRGQKAIS